MADETFLDVDWENNKITLNGALNLNNNDVSDIISKLGSRYYSTKLLKSTLTSTNNTICQITLPFAGSWHLYGNMHCEGKTGVLFLGIASSQSTNPTNATGAWSNSIHYNVAPTSGCILSVMGVYRTTTDNLVINLNAAGSNSQVVSKVYFYATYLGPSTVMEQQL